MALVAFPNEHLKTPSAADLQQWWPHLLLNCCIAFGLNVIIALFVKQSSAVSFMLAGIVKDAGIVFLGIWLFSETIGNMQALGFSLQLGLILVYTLIKSFPDKFEDGIASGLGSLIFGGEASLAPKLARRQAYGTLEDATTKSRSSAHGAFDATHEK